MIREDADSVIEIQGLLGILNIMGIEHLMVIVGREDICRIYHRQQSSPTEPTPIFELQEVQLIPFAVSNNPQKEYQLKQIRDGISKFLECGFYFSYKFDLTSNTQRRDRILVPKEPG